MPLSHQSLAEYLRHRQSVTTCRWVHGRTQEVLQTEVEQTTVCSFSEVLAIIQVLDGPSQPFFTMLLCQFFLYLGCTVPKAALSQHMDNFRITCIMVSQKSCNL